MLGSWKRRFDLLLLGFFFLGSCTYVCARSFRQPPLSSAAVVQDARILSWQLQSDTVHCTSRFTLLFSVVFPNQPSRQYRLSLEPNHDLFQDPIVEYIDNNGFTSRSEPLIRHEHKIYKGEAYIRDVETKASYPCGWARITVLRDGPNPLFEGVFLDGGEVNHVKLLSKYNSRKDIGDVEFGPEDPDETMVVYRDSDRYIAQAALLGRSVFGDTLSVDEANSTICAHDRLEFNVLGIERPEVSNWDILGRLVRRQTDIGGNMATGGSRAQLASTIGSTVGCSTIRRVALVGAAADCTYISRNGNSSSTRAHIISVYNQASALYEQQFNISLGLSNIIMYDSQCPATPPSAAPWNVACPPNYSMDDDLSVFSQWRGSRGNDSIALWTLFTGCSAGSEVGIAWLGMLCQYTSQSQGGQTVSGTNVVGSTQDEWKVLAHELGHGFGAYHDCTPDLCASTQPCCPLSASVCDANAQFIMNPTTLDVTNRFSPCSIGNICSGFANKQVSTSCLSLNRNVHLITAGECGNGIVEDGEQCDCGGPSGCAGNPCCDPKTCKLTAGSVCDDANDACCQHCRFAPSTKVCRPSIDSTCDPQETCTGNSSACPADNVVSDGTSCGDGLQCAAGRCTSRDRQCQQAVNGSSGACDSNSCALICASSTLGPNTCALAQGSFVDGTPCGLGGTCQSGSCESGGLGAVISSWVAHNKVLVIVLASVLGVLLLLCLAMCFRRRFRGKKTGFIPARQYPLPPNRNVPPPPPPRHPSMTYYPQAAPTYNARPQTTNLSSSYPQYSPPHSRSWSNDQEQLQQPSEEWFRGPDGSYYPPNSRPRPPPTPMRRSRYWES